MKKSYILISIVIFFIAVVSVLLGYMQKALNQNAPTPSAMIDRTAMSATILNQLNIPQNYTPGPTATTIPLETLITGPNYMSGCLAINPVRYTKQEGYLNIMPGVTLSDDLERLVGTPDVKRTDAQRFDNLSMMIRIDPATHIVIEIRIDQHANFPSLMEIIQKYGCPDVIYAINNSMDGPRGIFGATDFVYFKQVGISFRFWRYPVRFEDKPRGIDYFLPGIKALEDVYALKPPTYADPVSHLPVSWDAAIYK
jgi:hypothetical protein